MAGFATYTFNPWLVRGDTRRRTGPRAWQQVETWNRQAAPGMCDCPGVVTKPVTRHLWPCPAVVDRPRVFPSRCDPFEDWDMPMIDRWGQHSFLPTGGPIGDTRPVMMSDIRSDFFALIDRTQNLDWLLLTKRPENVRRMMEFAARGIAGENWPSLFPWTNVWLLYSASDQQSLEAGLPHLLACRDLVPVLGLSLEPLIGPVDLGLAFANAMLGPLGKTIPGTGRLSDYIGWIACGGESGPRASPCDVAHVRSVVEQCAEADVRCWVDQLGSNCVGPNKCGSKATCYRSETRLDPSLEGYPDLLQVELRHPKGGDPAEWPEDLRVRQFPRKA